MQNLRYYIRRELIGGIPNEKVEENYTGVNFEIKEMVIQGMNMAVTTHRILFTCESYHSLLVDLSIVLSVDMREQGVFSKTKWIELRTVFNDIVKLTLKNLNEAFIQIRGALTKGVWRTILSEKEAQSPKTTMYAGIYDHNKKINTEITQKEQKVTNSFANFDSLFQNARELKEVIGFLKDSLKVRDESFQNTGEVQQILDEMGFVSTITKEEAGKDYYKQEARNIFQICHEVLFRQWGGMVSLLDLYYFYNKKRQTCLISPEELLKACEQMPALGLNARVVAYSNNCRMLESTTLDPVADFEANYKQFFENAAAVKPEEISRKKNVPLVVVQIKMAQALKRGRILKDDRIEGLRYFDNLILSGKL